VEVNEGTISKSPELNHKIGLLRSGNLTERKFPKLNNSMPINTKYVYNEYHTRSTAGGYGRNNYGKPYWS